MSETISKKNHHDNPNSFEHLYQLGLTYIQQLSGHIWTDYNTHDPGMTILEQVCYALTDLIYRCEFEVPDYLSETSGNIDYRAHGLALPQDIMPACPQQPEEYETWLLARLPELDKVWLRWSEHKPHLGIYTLSAQLNHFYALSQQHGAGAPSIYAQQHAAIARIRSEFYRVRAVGEDLAGIELTGQNPLTLAASLHVSDDVADVTSLAATLYHRIGLWLESITQPTPVSVIKEFLLAEGGIQQIDSLQFIQYSDSAGQNEPVAMDTLAPFSYLKMPKRATGSGIKIIQFQHPVEIDYADLAIQIEQIQYERRAAQLHIVNPPTLPAGRYFNFRRYESIQTLFPRNYHLAPGIPNQYLAQQQGQRHQLRSYLLLFDQLMANFSDDIAGLNALFSLSLTAEKTYHTHLLQDDEFYNIAEHYPQESAARLEQLRAQLDNYPERKNRIFNYLLALYSERFPESLHRQFNPYYSVEALEKQLLKYKKAFILNIVTMTNGRGIGDNLLLPEHRGGYSQRLSLLLGLPPHAAPPHTLAKHSLSLMPGEVWFTHGPGKNTLSLLNPETLTQLQPLAENGLAASVDETLAQQILSSFDLFAEKSLPDTFLQPGIDNRRYRLLHRPSRDDYQLWLKVNIAGAQQWAGIATHQDPKALTHLAHHLQRWLIQLNQKSERLYVVEPILLRTGENNAAWKNEANRVTIVFPGYTARFTHPIFREQVEQLIIDNSPAHLLPELQWLDITEFTKFEALYDHWRKAKSSALQRDEEQPHCNALAQQLSLLIRLPQSHPDKARSL